MAQRCSESGNIKIVMTDSASDKEKMQPHIHDNKTKKLFEKRYKDTNNELKLVIVSRYVANRL